MNLIGPPTEPPPCAQWWQGPTLVQAIDSLKPSARDVHKPLRLPVTDVFKSTRGGAALGGRLAGGALKVGLFYAGELPGVYNARVCIQHERAILLLHACGCLQECAIRKLEQFVCGTVSWSIPCMQAGDEGPAAARQPCWHSQERGV